MASYHAPPSSIEGIPLTLDNSSSLSILERLRRARDQVAALKERVAGMRKAQENDIDWATCGKGPDPNISFRFEIRRLLRGHFNKVHACAWAGDDTTAASASQDGKMIIWNTFTRDKLDVIFLESNFAMSCAFESQTDSLVATGGLDNKCSVYAVGDGAVTKMRSVGSSYAREPVAELVGHEGYVSDIAFCSGQAGPVGRILTASGDGTVALWDLNASSSSSGSSTEGSRRSIVSSLSGGASGGKIKEGKGGAAISVFSDHQEDVMCIAVNPMDPNIFASGSCDKTLKIWDIRRPRAVCSFEGHKSDVNTVKFFPNGLSVCTGSDDSSCRVFDLRSCGPILVLSDERQQSGVTDVAVSKSGRLVFASYEDSCKQVAVSSENERNRAAIRAAAISLAASGKSAAESEDAVKNADSTAKAAASSSSSNAANDKISSSANLPCHVIAWETISSIGLFHELRGNTKRVSSLSVNSSGQALLAANWDHNLTIWA